MVPLLLLMKAGTQRCGLAPLRHCLKASLIVLGIALAGQTAQALTNALTITTTTYIDSRVSNQTLNYGHAHTVKALINNNVTSDGSMCRGLFQLPPQIWTYPPEQILSATVVFYVWQDNTASRNVTLYPLTRSFVQGTGNGTSPADGATWLTYDGTNPWTNPGGDFDLGLLGRRRQRRHPRSGPERPLFLLGHHRAAENSDQPGGVAELRGDAENR